MEGNKRFFNLDFIRAFAIFSVIAVHFLLNTNFYKTQIIVIDELPLIILRGLFIIGVPLFLMLSGYLLKNVIFSKKFYKKLFFIIGLYLIAHILTTLINVFVFKEHFSLLSNMKGFLECNYILYGWYVKMYVGLFLLIPFLNILWNNLPSQKEKIYLLLTLFVVQILPTTVSDNYKIFDYWIKFSPICYYFFGTYLSEYKLPITRKMNVLLLILSVVMIGVINFGLTWHHTYFGIVHLSDSLCIESFIVSVLFFNLILHINFENKNKYFKNFVSVISKYTYGMYLCAFIADKIVYAKFNALHFSNYFVKSNYAPFAVISAFILAFVFSLIITKVYKLCAKKE